MTLFVATSLVAPPTSEASIIPIKSPSWVPTICEVLPSGGIADYTI
ncbi:hypothetical protein [Methylobacterium sp. NFXW15]